VSLPGIAASAVGESPKQASNSAMRTGRTVAFLDRVSGSMVLPFFFPARLLLRFTGSEGAKNPAGKCLPPDSNPLEMRSLEKIASDRQAGTFTTCARKNYGGAKLCQRSEATASSPSMERGWVSPLFLHSLSKPFHRVFSNRTPLMHTFLGRGAMVANPICRSPSGYFDMRSRPSV